MQPIPGFRRNDGQMTKMRKAVEEYAGNSVLRALVQLAPTVGGPLDTLLTAGVTEMQQRRIQALIEELERAISVLDASTVQWSDFNSDEGLDLLIAAVRAATRHRSVQRLQALARVVANRAAGYGDWNQAEEALRIADQLLELDINVLHHLSGVKITKGAFQGTKTVTVEPVLLNNSAQQIQVSPPPTLIDAFPEADSVQLRVSISKLLMLGLVKDEGVGRWSTSASQFYSLTQAGSWFLEWLSSDGLSGGLG